MRAFWSLALVFLAGLIRADTLYYYTTLEGTALLGDNTVYEDYSNCVKGCQDDNDCLGVSDTYAREEGSPQCFHFSTITGYSPPSFEVHSVLIKRAEGCNVYTDIITNAGICQTCPYKSVPAAGNTYCDYSGILGTPISPYYYSLAKINGDTGTFGAIGYSPAQDLLDCANYCSSNADNGPYTCSSFSFSQSSGCTTFSGYGVEVADDGTGADVYRRKCNQGYYLTEYGCSRCPSGQVASSSGGSCQAAPSAPSITSPTEFMTIARDLLLVSFSPKGSRTDPVLVQVVSIEGSFQNYYLGGGDGAVSIPRQFISGATIDISVSQLGVATTKTFDVGAAEIQVSGVQNSGSYLRHQLPVTRITGGSSVATNATVSLTYNYGVAVNTTYNINQDGSYGPISLNVGSGIYPDPGEYSLLVKIANTVSNAISYTVQYNDLDFLSPTGARIPLANANPLNVVYISPANYPQEVTISLVGPNSYSKQIFSTPAANGGNSVSFAGDDAPTEGGSYTISISQVAPDGHVEQGPMIGFPITTPITFTGITNGAHYARTEVPSPTGSGGDPTAGQALVQITYNGIKFNDSYTIDGIEFGPIDLNVSSINGYPAPGTYKLDASVSTVNSATITYTVDYPNADLTVSSPAAGTSQRISKGNPLRVDYTSAPDYAQTVTITLDGPASQIGTERRVKRAIFTAFDTPGSEGGGSVTFDGQNAPTQSGDYALTITQIAPDGTTQTGTGVASITVEALPPVVVNGVQDGSTYLRTTIPLTNAIGGDPSANQAIVQLTYNGVNTNKTYPLNDGQYGQFNLKLNSTNRYPDPGIYILTVFIGAVTSDPITYTIELPDVADLAITSPDGIFTVIIDKDNPLSVTYSSASEYTQEVTITLDGPIPREPTRRVKRATISITDIPGTAGGNGVAFDGENAPTESGIYSLTITQLAPNGTIQTGTGVASVVIQVIPSVVVVGVANASTYARDDVPITTAEGGDPAANQAIVQLLYGGIATNQTYTKSNGQYGPFDLRSNLSRTFPDPGDYSLQVIVGDLASDIIRYTVEFPNAADLTITSPNGQNAVSVSASNPLEVVFTSAGDYLQPVTVTLEGPGTAEPIRRVKRATISVSGDPAANGGGTISFVNGDAPTQSGAYILTISQEAPDGSVQTGTGIANVQINVAAASVQPDRRRAAKRRLIRRSRCMGGETDCPTASGFECIDINSELTSCGGCNADGASDSPYDCTLIPNAKGVGCDHGRCVVFSCEGYSLVPSDDKRTCVRRH